MSNNEHSQHLASAEQARRGLATDLQNMNEAGENLIRHGKHRLKATTLTYGAVALGGLVAGVVLGRAGNSRRGSPLLGALLSKAVAAFAATLATQLVAKLLAKQS